VPPGADRPPLATPLLLVVRKVVQNLPQFQEQALQQMFVVTYCKKSADSLIL